MVSMQCWVPINWVTGHQQNFPLTEMLKTQTLQIQINSGKYETIIAPFSLAKLNLCESFNDL